MSHIFPRCTRQALPVAVGGDGCYGQRGDHILLAPPFIIEDSQLDELC